MSKNRITIKQIGFNDIPDLVKLNHALFQEDAGQRDPFMNLNWPHEEGKDYFTKLLHSEGSIGLFAVLDGKAVGYLIGYLKQSSTLRPVNSARP